MTPKDYETAKKDLIDLRWKKQHLTGSDSFTEHMRLQIAFLESIIHKYEDCYHINKPFIENIDIHIEAIK